MVPVYLGCTISLTALLSAISLAAVAAAPVFILTLLRASVTNTVGSLCCSLLLTTWYGYVTVEASIFAAAPITTEIHAGCLSEKLERQESNNTQE
jgi:hypothetical protein